MEFIKVTATPCSEEGTTTTTFNRTTLFINPDTIKAITESKSIVLKQEPNCIDDGIMAIGNNFYKNFEFEEVINLNELN